MKSRLHIFVIFVLYFFLLTSPIQAANIRLNPASGNYHVGDTISLDLMLDKTTAENVWGVSAELSFPETLLTYNNSAFKAGELFPSSIKLGTVFSSYPPVNISASFLSELTGVDSGGVVGSMQFTAKAAGTAEVKIVCPGIAVNTGIYEVASVERGETKNIINCDDAGDAVLSIAAAGTTQAPTATSPTSTPTQTVSSGTSTSGSTLTELPETGIFDGMNKLIFLGIGLIIIGGLFQIKNSRFKIQGSK